MAIIHVKSQSELDKIPFKSGNIIHIEFGTQNNPAEINNECASPIIVTGINYVSVQATNNHIFAENNSTVEAYNDTVVDAKKTSTVIAFDNTIVTAKDHSRIIAKDNSTVMAKDHSRVTARDNSGVILTDQSHIELHDAAQIIADSRGLTIKTPNPEQERSM